MKYFSISAFNRMPCSLIAIKIAKSTCTNILITVSISIVCTNLYCQKNQSVVAQAVDSYFKRLEAFGLSGSVLIGNKNEIIFEKKYGNTTCPDGVSPAYLVGSISKQFTATAILILEQEGLLNISDSISMSLSNIPPDKSGITIHQLLTHTSGLRDDYWDQHKTLSEKEYIEMMLSKELAGAPGTKFRYANFGYHLLAKVIESISSMDYEQFIVDKLFKPINMHHTGFKYATWHQNQVVEYTDWTTEGSEQIIKYPLNRPIYLQPEGSGGILSTTHDLYKWHQSIFYGNEILTEKSKNKLLTPDKEHYGYGWEIYETKRNTTLIEHGGYDSWVGVVTGFYNYIDEDIVVIFFGNTHLSQTLIKDDLMNDIEAIIFGGEVQMAPVTFLEIGDTNIDKIVGTYSKGKQTISIDKGKTENQIRLRTTNEEIVKSLLFPTFDNHNKNTDSQLDFIFRCFTAEDYEPLKGIFFNEANFDKIKNRYAQIWQELTSSMGKYKNVNVLHMLPNFYEGQFELQLFVEIVFERGSYYARAFRNHEGKIHLQHLDFPEKLELYLSAKSKSDFISWNNKIGSSASISFTEDQLIINNNPLLIFNKD